MDSLHGIKLRNSEVAARGRTLTFDPSTGLLSIKDGDPLTPVFQSRRAATIWAQKYGALVLPA